MLKKPVPWIFHDSPLMKAWEWRTEHFEVKIYSSGESSTLAWKVVDVSGGGPVTLETSESRSFSAAEEEILEIVGKSYPPVLGYWAYARELATTFVIKDGTKFDFGSYEGKETTLHVFNKKNPRMPIVITGVLHVTNFQITINPPNRTSIVIPPSFILTARKETVNRSQYSAKDSNARESNKRRIVHEEWRPGCTGQPGFAPNTVVHNVDDRHCPIHGY